MLVMLVSGELLVRSAICMIALHNNISKPVSLIEKKDAQTHFTIKTCDRQKFVGFETADVVM